MSALRNFIMTYNCLRRCPLRISVALVIYRRSICSASLRQSLRTWLKRLRDVISCRFALCSGFLLTVKQPHPLVRQIALKWPCFLLRLFAAHMKALCGSVCLAHGLVSTSCIMLKSYCRRRLSGITPMGRRQLEADTERWPRPFDCCWETRAVGAGTTRRLVGGYLCRIYHCHGLFSKGVENWESTVFEICYLDPSSVSLGIA